MSSSFIYTPVLLTCPRHNVQTSWKTSLLLSTHPLDRFPREESPPRIWSSLSHTSLSLLCIYGLLSGIHRSHSHILSGIQRVKIIWTLIFSFSINHRGYPEQKTLQGCAANMGSKISLLVYEWPLIKCKIWYTNGSSFKNYPNIEPKLAQF